MEDLTQKIDASGKTIPELMGEMMDRGYIVTGRQGSVSLMKMATDSDTKVTINPGAENPSVLGGFETKMHAIARYLDIRDDEEPVVLRTIRWTGQVRYQIGRSIKFHDFMVVAATYQEALDLGKIEAEAFVESQQHLKQFGYQEVRVRPDFTEA